MTNVAALPALALLVGAAAGVYAPVPPTAFVACAVIGWLALTLAVMTPSVSARFGPFACVATLVGFFGVSATLAAHATRDALTPPILADTHAVRVDVAGAAGAVPVVLSGVIRTDASATEFGAMFALDAETIQVNGVERETAGSVRIAVGGTSASRHIGDWRAGRRVRVTATLAAPLPYLNIGTPNQETRLALAGIRLFGSVKSASQVELLAHGRWWDEAAASARAFVRHALAAHVASGKVAANATAAKAHGTADGYGTGADGHGADRNGAGSGAAIATAVLIGDRAGLDQDVEERLQRAGTFHVIAISGGNIAILTALILGLLRLVGLSPRTCAWLTLSAIGIYAFIVGSGASVARAALAAIVYLFARAIDHRTPPVNVLAVVVAMMLVWAPLEIVDAGFWLTCLATLAIMLLAQRLADHASVALQRMEWRATPARDSAGPATDIARDSPAVSTAPAATSAANHSHGVVTSAARLRQPSSRGIVRARLTGRLVEAAGGLLAATVAAEAVLLPVTAYAFSQVSIAGLVLNFFAIPLMTVVQVAGIAIVLCAGTYALAPMADMAGVIVDLAARGIVSSSSLVDAAPWSAPRVAPPPLWLLFACQLSLCLAWFGRPPPWRRRAAACAWLACLALIVWALPLPSFTLHAIGSEECRIADAVPRSDPNASPGFDSTSDRGLRVTFLDVAQGDATLIRFPDGRAWLVDTGGALGRFDIGTRIVSPALWALGLRRLSTLVLTHGDRDHIGGAHAMLRDFRPAEVWEGVPVDGHVETTHLRNEAARRRMRWRTVQTGEGDAYRGRLRLDDRPGDHAAAAPDVTDVEGVVDVADVDIRIWHPSASEGRRTRVRNDDSIVLELALRNVSVVLPGDIGSAVERVLAARHALPPSSLLVSREPSLPEPSLLEPPAIRPRVTTVNAAAPDAPPTERLPAERRRARAHGLLRVLKVPHHGSKTSSTAAFLDALQPRLAIVSAGRGNRHGHPAPAALARYAARGTEVFRTDRDGAIQLDTDGRTVTVRTCSGRSLTLRSESHGGDAGGIRGAGG